MLRSEGHLPYRDLVNAAGQRELAWIYYYEEVDEDCNVLPITMAYAERDMADPDRPAKCNLPYTPIIPPEVIELVTWFENGRLVDSAIRVHVNRSEPYDQVAKGASRNLAAAPTALSACS